ncbi:MAG: hypothetical protein HRU38_06880 [Saccharospirillaceae bacterium]|nr:hypothetical protein [Saccharospirillaceae bacterium]
MTSTLNYSITNQSENLSQNENEITVLDNYPLHNVVVLNKKEQCLMLSLAGYDEDCIKIETRMSDDNIIEIVVKGTPTKAMCTSKDSVTHKNFEIKKFEKIYKLLPFMQVTSIEMINGILGICFSKFEPKGLGRFTLIIN